MACKFIVNGQESNLYNTILEAYNGDEELAITLHSYFKNDIDFLKNFGNWIEDYGVDPMLQSAKYDYKPGESRIEENGEPKLYKNEKNGNYYYIDKDKNKVEIIENSKSLKGLFSNEQIERITKVLVNDYFKNNLKIDFENINLDSKSISIRESVINKLNERIDVFKASGDYLFEDTAELLEIALNENLDEIVNNVINSLETYKIKYSEDFNNNDEDTDLAEIEINENEKDPSFGIASNERTTKNNTSANIKLRLSLIEDVTQEDEFLNDVIYKSFDEIYASLLPELTNQIAVIKDNVQEDRFELLKAEILKFENKKPYFKELYRILSQPDLSNEIKNEFSQAFNLDTNNYNTTVVKRNEDGTVEVNNINISETGKKESDVFNEWNKNFKDKFVTETADGIIISKEDKDRLNIIKSDLNKIKYDQADSVQSMINILRKLGIENTTKGFQHFLDDFKLINNDNELSEEKFNKLINDVNYFIKGIVDNKNQNYDSALSDQAVFKQLARGEAFYISEGSDASVFTAGKQKWVYSYPSYLSNTIKSWKKDRNILLKHYEVSKYNEGSDWMKYLLALNDTYQVNEFIPIPAQERERIEESKKRIDELEIFSFNTYQMDENSREGKDNKTISKQEYLSDTINKILGFTKGAQSFYRTTTPADKGTQYELAIGRNISTNARYGENGNIIVNDEAIDVIFNYFDAEYKRMKFEREFMNDPKNADKLRVYYHLGAGHAFKSQLFPSLSSDKIKDSKVSFNNIYDENGNAYLSTLKNSQFEYDIKSYITNELSNGIQETLDNLIKNKIFEETSEGIVNKELDTKIWNSYKSDNALKASSDFFINSLISHVEYSKMFAGDVAYYKNAVDYKKRVPATYTDGLYQRLDNVNKDYVVASIESVEIDSPFLPELVELLGEDLANKYRKINSADAQAWITPARWKTLVQSIGKWNTVYDSVYEKLLGNNNEPFTAEELKAVAPPLKGVYFQTVNGVPIFLKYSQAVLSPRLRKGNELEKIYNQMVAQNVDELVTFDAIKVGSNQPTKIHNDNGQLLDNFEFKPFTIPSNGWKLQQDLPVKGVHDTEVGSQIQKNIFQGLAFNLDKNFTLDNEEVSGNQMVENIANVIGELSNLGYESVLKEFGVAEDGTITNIEGFYNSIISELKSRGGSQNVIDALESEISIYGVAQAKDKLQNIFSSILTKRILKIKTNGGSFIQMSNFGLNKENADKQGVIWSPRALSTTHEPQYYINEDGKKVIRPGGILLSGSFIAKYIPDYKKYTPEQLFGYNNENLSNKSINIWAGNNQNTILSNLAIRPFVYQNEKYNSVEEYFQLQKSNYLKESLYENNLFGENSLESVTKNNQLVSDEIIKNENNPFKIKQLGRKFQGLDTKEWDKNALIEMEKVLKISFEQNPEALKILLNTGNSKLTHNEDKGRWNKDFPNLLMKVRKELQKENNFNFENEFVEGIIDRKIQENIIGYRIPNQGLSSNDALEIVGILPEENGDTVVAYTGITTKTGSDYDIDKMYLMFPAYKLENNKLVYQNYDTSKSESEQTKEALQNRLIELYKSVLLNENVIGEVMTPVDFDYIKNDIRSIAKVTPTTNLSTFNQLKDIDVKYSFLAGKAGVGQQANSLMDYVLGSLANLSITNFEVPKSNDRLDKEYSQELSQSELDYYLKEVGGDTSLKSIKIGNSLSAILNAFVDIAKDPYITEGNWVTMTTNTGNLLLRKGVHPFYVNAFLAQPVIKEYVEFSEQYESSQNQGVSTQEAFIEQRFGKENYDDSYKTNIFNKTLKDLREGVVENEDSFQMNAFNTFLEYQSASKAIKTNIDASKFMVNGIGGSINSLIMSKNAVDSILDAEDKYNSLSYEDKDKFRKNIILGFSSKFTNPNGSESMFSKYYKNIIIKPEQIVKANPKLFLVANDTIQDTFNEISHNVNNEILLNEDLSKQLDKTFYSYIMSGFQPLKLTNQERRDLTLNFPKEFESFKEENEGLYSIIDQLSIKQGDTLDFVGLNNRKKSKEFEDSMINSFLDLLNDNEEFANKLIQYSYLTSGFNNHMSQFFTMIPTQWFNRNNINRYIIDASFDYNNYGGTNDDIFIDSFYLSNLEDKKLVKNITDGQIQSELRNANGFLVKKPGKVGYFRIKTDPNGINPPIYFKLIGYNSNYQGVYTRFIPNINGEYTDIKNLNVKDKKGNRIINFDIEGINLKEPTKGIAGIINKQQLEFFNQEAIYPRDIFYRENVIIKKESEIENNVEVYGSFGSDKEAFDVYIKSGFFGLQELMKVRKEKKKIELAEWKVLSDLLDRQDFLENKEVLKNSESNELIENYIRLRDEFGINLKEEISNKSDDWQNEDNDDTCVPF